MKVPRSSFPSEPSPCDYEMEMWSCSGVSLLQTKCSGQTPMPPHGSWLHFCLVPTSWEHHSWRTEPSTSCFSIRLVMLCSHTVLQQPAQILVGSSSLVLPWCRKNYPRQHPCLTGSKQVKEERVNQTQSMVWKLLWQSDQSQLVVMWMSFHFLISFRVAAQEWERAGVASSMVTGSRRSPWPLWEAMAVKRGLREEIWFD